MTILGIFCMLSILINSKQLTQLKGIEMIKRLMMAMLAMSMSVMATASTNNDPNFPADSDPHEYAIGYKNAKNGSGYPPEISEIVANVGKRDYFEVAINTEKTKGLKANVGLTNINLSDMNENQVYSVDNIIFTKVDGISIIKVLTKGDFKSLVIQDNDYTVTYKAGGGYFLMGIIETNYKPENSMTEQKEYLTGKTRLYLKDKGYKENDAWYTMRDFPTFVKDDIVIRLPPVVYFRASEKSFVISIENKKYSEKYKETQEVKYNTEFKDKFTHFDQILK